MLELKGGIVTIDVMGCQQEIAQGILDRGAGYVLALSEGLMGHGWSFGNNPRPYPLQHGIQFVLRSQLDPQVANVG